VQQTLFFRDIQRDYAACRKELERILGDPAAPASRMPASTFIEQPPLSPDADLALSATAVIPHGHWNSAPSSHASGTGRFIILGACRYLHGGGICGDEGDAHAQTLSMFRKAEDWLQHHSMDFHDVVRTWIYLRHMERDYGEFNRGRREFFRQRNITILPASTGIRGAPYPAKADLALGFLAARAPRRLEMSPMVTPTLNEACTYGSDFSRGLRVVEGNRIALFVSGTASVDEEGRTAHPGDFEAQVRRMLLNVETLLAAQNASFRDVLSAVTYLKSAEDAAALRRIFADLGVGEVPNMLVHAAVCRPDLLCEMEAVAAQPLP
jgi:enamine deaminase RidA (YjgF/YER057c/UK114 family)